MNKNGLINLSKNFKRKIIKFDANSNKIISKDASIYDLFKNKKILMIYPFPAKERLNSELYDDILRKVKLSKEIEENKVLEDSEKAKIEKFQIFKTKYLNNIDEIIGLSELNEKKTEQYVLDNKIQDIWYIIDESKVINTENKFDPRYEVLIDDLYIRSYKPDPNFYNLSLIGFSSIYLFIILGLINLNLYVLIFKTKKENENKYEKIYKAI